MAKPIKLTKKNDTFDAGGGNDEVLGLKGNDKIDGGAGNDILNGGKGNDKLTSNAGNDELIGGKGNDTAIIGGNFADATVVQNGNTIIITIGGRTITAKGVESFQFDDQTVTADVLVNDAPTGAATAVLTAGTEDTAYIVSEADLLQGFSDVDGDTLSVDGLTASDGATVVDNGDGTYTITPAANDNGAVTLSYNVVDGRGGSVAGTNTVNFTAVNDEITGAPTADLADGVEDTVYTGNIADLLAGFSDADGDALTVSNLAVDNGTIVDNGDGTFTITTAANFNGTVNIDYDVTDGNGSTVAAGQEVDFAAVNDAPAGTATAVLAAGTEDTAYVVSAADLLMGFSDVEGDTLSVSGLTASDGATVVDNGNGTFTITPAADDNGIVTLSYNVVDGNGGSTAASNTVNFAAVNDAPAGTPSAALPNGTEDSVYVVTVAQLLQGMSDVDGDTLSVANLVASDGATVVDNGNGTFSITPAANDNGVVTLNYDVLDGNGGTTAVSNSVTFNAVNDAPTGASTADLIDGTEDTAYVVAAADLLAGFSDAEGDTLSVANLVASDGATIVDNGDGTYTVTPALDFTGTIELDYDVIDGNGGSVAASTDFDVVASKALTAGTDSITNLTSGDDTITGAAGTLNAADLIVDNFSNDADELNITLTAVNGAATISGIEEINVNWDSFAAAAFDATNVKGADIELSSTKLGFLGAASITGAGNNTITAGTGMTGALTVAGVTASTINATNSSTVTADGSGATTDSVTVNAGASTTTITVGDTTDIETVTINAGAATTSIKAEGYNTATINAGTATAIDLEDDLATDTATVIIGANATVDNAGSLGKVTLNIADGKTVSINNIGADLTVSSAGSVTVSSGAISTETIVDGVTGTFTLVSTATGAVDFSKADADLFVIGTLTATGGTFISGDNVRADVDLGAGAFTIAAASDTAADKLNVSFTKSQTATTFTLVETANITAAATAVVGTDLTLTSLVNAGNAVTLNGTNDVLITALNAKSLDASALVGDLTVTSATTTDVTITGATGVNTVTFQSATPTKASFIGQGGADIVDFQTLAATGTFAAVTGAGNDTVKATVGSLAAGSLSVDGGEGNDDFQITGTLGATSTVVLQGGNGTDTLSLANTADLTAGNLTPFFFGKIVRFHGHAWP